MLGAFMHKALAYKVLVKAILLYVKGVYKSYLIKLL